MQVGVCFARIVCFVIVAKSNQHCNSPTFSFLANTKLLAHNVYSKPAFAFANYLGSKSLPAMLLFLFKDKGWGQEVREEEVFSTS